MQRERSSTSSSPGGEAGICIEVGAGDCEEEEAVPEGPGGPERIFSQHFEADFQRQRGGFSCISRWGGPLGSNVTDGRVEDFTIPVGPNIADL